MFLPHIFQVAESRHTFGSLMAEPEVLREIRDQFQRELVELVKMASFGALCDVWFGRERPKRVRVLALE